MKGVRAREEGSRAEAGSDGYRPCLSMDLAGGRGGLGHRGGLSSAIRAGARSAGVAGAEAAGCARACHAHQRGVVQVRSGTLSGQQLQREMAGL